MSVDSGQKNIYSVNQVLTLLGIIIYVLVGLHLGSEDIQFFKNSFVSSKS